MTTKGQHTPGPFWYCNVCGAQNHKIDGECQFCECEGAACMRDNCSDPAHFCPDSPEHDDCQSRRTCQAPDARALLAKIDGKE